MSYKIFVPTCGRKNPNILQMLQRDKQLVLSLCVRSEDDDNGFYDHFKNNNQIEIIRLGYGLDNLGETRQRIMEYCNVMDIDYAIMLDDTLTNIKNLNNELDSITDICFKVIYRMTKDIRSEIAILYQFNRVGRKYSNVDLNEKYFVGTPLQAFVINVKLAFKKGLSFKKISEVGWEDAAFFVDSLKEGLVTLSESSIVIEGDLPNGFKEGGTHSVNEDITIKNDIAAKNFIKYVGPMYGVYLIKRFSPTVGCDITYNIIDLAFFKECLVDRRNENLEMIRSRFKIV